MPWIRVFTDYDDNPKTIRLKELLKNHLADAYPQRLWRWALKHAPGGTLAHVSVECIAKGCGVQRRAREFVEALIEAGFIDRDTMQIHDWYDGSGQYETKTIRGRERVAKHRRNAHVTVTSALRNAHVTLSDPDPDPDPDPDQKIKIPPTPTPKLSAPRRGRASTASSTPTQTVKAQPLDDLADVLGDPPDNGNPANLDFEAFIGAYPPQRRDRPKSDRAWYSVNGDRPGLAVVLAALERDKASEDWGRERGRYIPSAEKWLVNRQWERLPEKEPF